MDNPFELLARWGYAARGVVYVILGAIALAGAVGGGGAGGASTEGALSTVLAQPFGRVLLAAIAIGLIGHVLWRLAQAVFNADHQKDDAKGYVARIGNFASGLANAALASEAARAVFASSGGGGQGGAASWLMEQPFGPVLVGVLGAAIAAAGVVQVWRGVSGKYAGRVKLPSRHRGLLHAVSVSGLSARGVLLTITGGFFMYAAATLDGGQSGGLTEALDWVRELPFGVILYALAAAGLGAFGLYSFIEARYRQLDAPETADIKRTVKRAA